MADQDRRRRTREPLTAESAQARNPDLVGARAALRREAARRQFDEPNRLIGATPTAGPALKPLGPSEPKDVPDPRYAGIRAERKQHEAIMGGYDDVNRMNEKYGETARREGRGYTPEEQQSITSRIDDLTRMSREPASAEKPDTVPETRRAMRDSSIQRSRKVTPSTRPEERRMPLMTPYFEEIIRRRTGE